MKKLYYIIFIIIILCSFMGCENKMNESVDEVVLTTQSNNIEDYVVQNKDKPLNVVVVDKERFKMIKNHIAIYKDTSSKQLLLSDVASNYPIGEMRKFKIDGEDNYYCIYSYNNEKIYVFYDCFGENWRCYTFLSSSSDNFQTNELYSYISKVDLYYTI